jgi:hypothetical protein
VLQRTQESSKRNSSFRYESNYTQLPKLRSHAPSLVANSLPWHNSEVCRIEIEIYETIYFSGIFLIAYFLVWSSGQSSWLQIQRSGSESRRYQIFWEVVALERGPLSLVSTTEELRGRKSSGSGLESREYGRRDTSRWPRGTLYQQTLALTSPTSSGSSVGIVRSRTQATEFVCLFYNDWSRKPRIRHVGIRHADHTTPSIRKSWH